MSIRKNLLNWQFENYSDNHKNKINFIIHIVTVPMFWLGLVRFIAGILTLNFSLWRLVLPLILVPLVAQGIGHRKETVPPVPFLSFLDFISRFIVEQTITFPRWFFGKINK